MKRNRPGGPSIELLENRRLLTAGDQDLTYGNNGFLTLNFGSTPYQFMPGSDPNGAATIVSMTSSGKSFMLRKFNNGAPDTSAGAAGVFAEVALPFAVPAGRRAAPARIWNLSGGRTLIEFIVPQTLTSDDGYFVRLKADNTVDSSYADNGFKFFLGRFLLKAAQQGDKLLALPGTTGSSSLSRYNDDGTVDRTFGTNGIARTDRYTSQLLVQPDGKIVLGTAYLLSPKVYRYTASGQLDTSFGGGDGKTVIQDEQADIQGLALDSAGRIVTAGGVIARLTPEGLLDATFGTQGVAKAGGEVVVDNQLAVTPFGGLQFVRVDENGNPDSAFGTVTVNLGTGQANRTLADPAIDQPQTLLVRPDGSVLVGRRFGDGRFVQVRIDDAGSDPGPITVSNTGALNISGTDSADRIFMDLGNLFSDFANVTLNGIGKVLHTSQLTEIIASGNGGNDDIGTMALSLARRVTLIGGDGDDTLRGSYGGDSISGDAGNDSIDGANGADILSGGDGDDTILGGDQSDQISGNDGRDRLLGGRGHDRIFGGASGDRLYGQGGDDQLNGEGGNDRIYGDDFGGDTLRGGAGDDLLVSRDGAGDDQLFGDGGRDTSIADAADLLTSIEVLS